VVDEHRVLLLSLSCVSSVLHSPCMLLQAALLLLLLLLLPLRSLLCDR
jgi:hypothetical protein